MVANFPRLIQLAIARVDLLISSSFFRRGRSKGLKAMRSDHAENCKVMFVAMLQGCCLEFDGALCRVSNGTARPLTIPEISQFSKKNQRTIERCQATAKDLGLLHSEKQFKCSSPDGLKVAAVWRVFTRLFWEKLGLWSLYVESVKHAAANAKLKLRNPVKLVGKKKPPDPDRANQRRRKAETLLFIAMSKCRHRKNEKSCSGAYQTAEICDMCRRFSC